MFRALCVLPSKLCHPHTLRLLLHGHVKSFRTVFDCKLHRRSRRAQRLSEVLSQAGVSPGINGPLGGDLLPTFDDETPGQDRLREALSMHNSKSKTRRVGP
jgi:hypothetical protein